MFCANILLSESRFLQTTDHGEIAEQLATCCYVQSDTEGVEFATRAVTAREHDGGTHERKFTVGETLQ